jgi:hypothetical protein
MSETTGAPGGWGETPAPRLEAPPVVAPPPFHSPPPAEPSEPLVPWTSIWSRPRATLRQILETDPRRSVFLLAALGGIAGALDLATASGTGEAYPIPVTLAIALAGGALGGVLFLFVFTPLVRVAGRWLGGRGETTDIMAALAWANVPSIWSLLLWLPRGALLGEETFRLTPSVIEGNPPAALFLGFLNLAQTLIGLWGFVITLKCLGEAHRFSAGRALVTLALAALMILAPIFLLMVAAQALS